MLFTLIVFLTHAIGVNIYKNTLNLLLGLFMATLIWDGSTYLNTSTGTWLGVNVPRTEQTDFTFSNNRITSYNSQGYMLQAGDETPSIYNYNLDGEKITGNYFNWLGDESSTSIITHGLFAGCTRNAVVKYNYLNHVPMAIIRKDASNAVDASGGVSYNIVNGGKVAVNIKGLSGVQVYNNTFYCDKTTSETNGRPLVFIYTNTDVTPNSKAEGTKIYNNIFYTKYQTRCITLSDSSCLNGFESDYNVFWNESHDGSIRFGYLGSTLTFEQWQALGYDQHSVVTDPSFIDFVDFVPRERLDYGTNLGIDYSTGLATDASWNVGITPNTTIQNGTWQVGAVLYEAETPQEDGSVYYVSNSGNDASSGRSPETAWRTIDKVNASMGSIEPGESILFRRGDTFYGTINITKSGTSGNPITFGAYGTGADPIITGFTTVTGWNVYSGNIYEASLNTAEAQTNMVVVDGSTVGMGRYPDSGWLEYTTTNNSTTIYDSDLPDSPDWTGAEVVINKEYWIIDRCNITDHASGTITFSGGKYNYTAPNRRYFIQNDIRCVTTTNEWYHNTSNQNFYIYGNPSSKDVKVATLNYLLYNNGYDYININDLAFKGSISHAIYFNGSTDNCRIEDCDITFAGGSAIENYGGDYLEANRNVISHSNYGIYLTGTNCNARYNDISYIGLINGSPFMPHATGIYLSNTNTTIEYNRIQYISWSGINTSSVATFTIARNFVNYACLRIDDGGGIYATSSSGSRYITQNIVLNSGIGAEDWLIITRGIYYDAGGSGANITDNVVAGCRGAGLLIHYGDNHVITGNLLFNNQRQAEFLKYGTGVTTGTVFNNNQLIAKEATQLTLRANSYTTAEIQAWGTFDYNFYARPIDDDNHFYYSSGYHTLSDWQTLVSPDDSHSRGSFTTVSSTNEILFYYNETSTNKVVASLTLPKVDVSGNTYPIGDLSLAPYTGIVLLPNPSANVYYVSNTGNDASAGTSPSTAWKTIDKVNASLGNIDAGDTIVFRRGDSFYGTLNITKSGIDGSTIVFGAYGTGEKPIITGFTTISSGWTSIGNGIYSRDISADQQTNMVLIDGTQYAMGRWPKGTTYNTFESHDGSLSITDNTLSSTPDWTGADVVIRQNWWTQTRFKIINHDGSTIVYNDGSNPDADAYMQDGFGYFIQNDLSTLYIDPSYGEWYHDTSAQKLYVYFGAEDPSTKTVQVATKGNLVSNATSDYLTFNNLSFIGCTSTALSFTPYVCTNITITDCSIQYAGLDGISELGEDASVYRNTVQNCNQGGIVFTGDNGRVTYNTIKNIGLIPGQAYKNGFSTAIRIGSTNAVVNNNYIQNVGYNGISGGTGTSASVKYNYIDNVCRTINDGGGIYHGQSNSVTPPGQWVIEYNIILNTYGNTNGTSTPTTYLGEGIYLDSWCRDASVRYNICANNRGTGIKIGSGRYNTIEDNLCFNNYEAQLYVLGSWAYPTIIDNTILRNQFIAKEATQLTLKLGLSASDNISNYGTSNYNIYARPIDDVSNSIYTTQTGGATNYRSLSSWQTFSGEDANSRTSYTTVSSTNEILFYYNETSTNKVVASLTTPMVDVSGNTYPIGNLTLSPYSGVVLMPSNDVSVYFLAPDGSDNSGDGTIENPWFSLNKVWEVIEPGDTVYMRDGSYGYTYRQYLTGVNGSINARINIWAYPGENPHIVEPDDASFARNTGYVIYFKGDYFHWKGIEISNYKQLNYDEMTFPFRSEDSDHNIFELLTVHDCGFGIHIGGSSDDNLFLNCDIYNIYDPLSTSSVDGSLVADPYEDGDGFSIGYGGLGTTNTYRGCRAWNIADDGWDLWRSDSHVIIDRCWTWNCGFAPDGSIGGNGNGFKLGITETSTAWAGNPPILRTITNSITYGNRASGVHQNGSYCATQFYNNIAYDNGDYGFWMASYNVPHVFKNNISYANGYAAITTAESIVEYNTFLVGNNQTNPSFNVTDNDFISINASSLSAPRQANGDLPVIQFLHLAPGSDLIHAGTDISTLTYDGDGSIWNSPPSLGAFEYFGQDTSVSRLVFYVSADGSDNYSGTSSSTPWQTIDKVNASLGSLSPGDGVLFRRGDTFYGTINVAESGSAGNPITFGAYGTGAKPIISGFTTISSWTSIGNGIYSTDVACESSCNMVIIDGSQYALGKWPSDGWHYIDNTDGNTYISDASITNDYNWTGAEIVIRKNRWVIDRCQITNHDGSTLSFSNTSSYPAQVSWGYFIQRSASTLDDFGDWHHDNSNGKLYMYFGAENPNNHIVKISTLDRGIYNWAYDYISVDNIRFEGANAEAFYGYNSPSHQTIQNCEIYFSGKDAIYIHYPFYCLIDNNVIDFTNSTAINATSYHSDGSTRISNNTITNTFTFPGMGHPGDGTTVAIAANGHNGIIENNTIINTGYLPINYGGRNTIVRNNYINTYCYIKDDGGGIYTYADNFTGKQVLNNIILNAIGAPNGSRINYYYPYLPLSLLI